jgi:hypothetical protein
MFRNLPKIIVPVSTFESTDTELSGTITIDEKRITGVSTHFIDEIVSGAELYVDDLMVGMISKISSDTVCFLEEPADAYTGVATIRNFQNTGDANPVVLSDILFRITVNRDAVRKSSFLMPYVIVENETPEMVSYNFYGTPLHHWVILLINEIVNPREEWPISETQLLEKIALQYPENNRNDIYEWREKNYGYVVEYDEELEDDEEIYSVTIYEYETEKNEAKRNIKVLDSNFITEFITEFNRAYTEIT